MDTVASVPEDGEKIIEIQLERLRTFKNHPFKVRMDQEMIRLSASVEKYGIINPLIVRPIPDGVYEIISGHRRKAAAEKFGYRKVPVIIRVMSDDEAVINMVDSNLQRQQITFSEKAFAYKMKNEAMKRTGGRRKSSQSDYPLKGKKTVEIIGEEFCDSAKQVQRYLKLTALIPELLEKLEEGQAFMTTSCCPSYIELVEKHIPDLKPYVSTTGSPMYYAARIAKEKHPDAKIVFVGPCVAKRQEIRRDEAVDFILTFEEIGSILDGMDIRLEQAQPFSLAYTSVREAHGFAQAGGVMGAVKAYLKEEADKINAIQVSDINKKNIALLRACAKTGKAAGQFIEVMACEGGCITGPSTHNDIVSGRRQLVQSLLKRKESYENMG